MISIDINLKLEQIMTLQGRPSPQAHLRSGHATLDEYFGRQCQPGQRSKIPTEIEINKQQPTKFFEIIQQKNSDSLFDWKTFCDLGCVYWNPNSSFHETLPPRLPQASQVSPSSQSFAEAALGRLAWLQAEKEALEFGCF